jgi:hypothetical protein
VTDPLSLSPAVQTRLAMAFIVQPFVASVFWLIAGRSLQEAQRI